MECVWKGTFRLSFVRQADLPTFTHWAWQSPRSFPRIHSRTSSATHNCIVSTFCFVQSAGGRSHSCESSVTVLDLSQHHGHATEQLSERSERTLYSCQLRFPIYIYVRVVRVWCPVFSVYSGSSIDLKIIVYLGYPGILMFATVRVFKVSTRMGTIKNKMCLETKIFRNAHTDTRAQQQLFESSEGSTKVPSVSLDSTLVGLQLYQHGRPARDSGGGDPLPFTSIKGKGSARPD